jgi:hypothetical protein
MFGPEGASMFLRECEMVHALLPTEIDLLGEYVLERLLAPGGSARCAVRDLVMHMAREHPHAQALSPVLVLAIVANGLDETLAEVDRPAGTAAADLWRMATLLATDVMALEQEHAPRHSVAELLGHWRGSDGFFLA